MRAGLTVAREPGGGPAPVFGRGPIPVPPATVPPATVPPATTSRGPAARAPALSPPLHSFAALPCSHARPSRDDDAIGPTPLERRLAAGLELPKPPPIVARRRGPRPPAGAVLQPRLLEVAEFRVRLQLTPDFYELDERAVAVRRLELHKIEAKLDEYAQLDTFQNPQLALDIVREVTSLAHFWLLMSSSKLLQQPELRGTPVHAQALEQMEKMRELIASEFTLELQLLESRIKFETPEEQVKRNLAAREREQRGEVARGGPPPSSTLATAKEVTAAAAPVASTVSGATSLAGVVSKLAGEKDTSKAIGNLGGGINDAAGALLGVVGGIADTAKGLELTKGDPAEVAKGSGMIFAGTLSVGSSVGTLVSAAQRLANFIGGLSSVPLGGLLSAPLKLAAALEKLFAHQGLLSSAKSGLASLKEAKKGEEALALSLEHVRVRTMQLVTHDVTDMLSTGLGLLGSVFSLVAGPVAPAGVAVTSAAMGVSTLNMVSKTLIDSYKAGKAQEAERDYGRDELGAAAKLIKLHPYHAAQTIVEKAKKRDPIALGLMDAAGLDEQGVAESSDQSLRALLLYRIDEEENPRTLLQKVKEAPSKLVAFFSRKD